MNRLQVAGWLSLSVMLGWASIAGAAALPVDIELTNVRTIQSASLDPKAQDQIYLLVSGVAAGNDVSARLPKDGTLPAAPKQPAVTDKAPMTIWKGELNDGQFAMITVTLMQGDGSDTDKVKDFLDKLKAEDQKTPQWSQKTIAAADVTKFATGLIKNQQELITKIKDIFSRTAKTDHYGGQFNVLVWNNGGKISKRLDPIGLTFGEHYGTDLKIYTKLKATRTNVMALDDSGQWTMEQLPPLDDDQTTIRVKMLETESMPNDKATKHVTDYLTEIQVRSGKAKPEEWNLEDEQTGYDNVHTYYNYAD